MVESAPTLWITLDSGCKKNLFSAADYRGNATATVIMTRPKQEDRRFTSKTYKTKLAVEL